MPLPVAHSLFSASFVALIYPKNQKNIGIPLTIGAFLANSPDFDFALVILFGSKDWHRGFTHSILFAAIVFLAIYAATKFERRLESIALGAAFASHFFLDFITTKIGEGLELFWFFDSERYGLRWFGLSEKSAQMTLNELLTALTIETIIFTPIFLLAFYFRKKYLQTQ